MQIAVSAQTVVSFPTGNSRIAVGLTLLAVYGLFDDILQPNYSRAAVLHQARKKHTATIDSPVRMLFCSLERFNHDHAARENYV